MRPTLALALIVKNEEHNLPILLKSVEGCFDEIHITDTGSTDKTVEIAQSFGAKVNHFEWINDFSAARNESIKDIKTDYICWLDADDSLEGKEAFIEWRDNALVTADYWLAAYHYAINKLTGAPACTFVRERIFRNSGKFSFKYFVHEGLVPEKGYIPKAAYVQTWSVKHRRTEEDLKKDKGRNLKLFDFHKDKLDDRMKFYYGKEYFENGDPISAVRWLMEALTSESLEQHDRLLAFQYCVYSLVTTNQLDRAVQVAMDGLQLYPHRAELWVSVADCFLKQNRQGEAIPFLNAAKNCHYHDAVKTGLAQPVFNQKDAYVIHPRNQLAKIYCQGGDFDRAEKEATECLSLQENQESRTILYEINKVKDLIQKSTKAEKIDCDDIVITGTPNGFYEWDSEIYKSKGIGGSETAAVEMAQHLHELSGRKVRVFNNRTTAKFCGGVEYLPIQEAPRYFSENRPYAHIAWRHNFALTDADTYVWSHDLITPGAEAQNYKKLLVLSDFHKHFVKSLQGIKEDKIRIIRNGIDPSRFVGIKKAERKPVVVYRSSPDRGLNQTIAVMDVVRKTLPDMELHVYYGFDNLYKNNMGQIADEMKQKCAQRPWIKLKGNVDQKTLSEECSQSMIWLFPTDFPETYCIGAIETLCEGVYPIVRRFGALKDTLHNAEKEGMCTMLDSECVTDAQIEEYAQAVVEAVKEKKWERVSVDPEGYSWRQEAQSWLKWIEEDKKEEKWHSITSQS